MPSKMAVAVFVLLLVSVVAVPAMQLDATTFNSTLQSTNVHDESDPATAGCSGMPKYFSNCKQWGGSASVCCDERYAEAMRDMCEHPNISPCRNVTALGQTTRRCIRANSTGCSTNSDCCIGSACTFTPPSMRYAPHHGSRPTAYGPWAGTSLAPARARRSSHTAPN